PPHEGFSRALGGISDGRFGEPRPCDKLTVCWRAGLLAHPPVRPLAPELPRGSSPSFEDVGAWLSLVEHSVRDRGVGGSNPLAPTKINQENWPSIDRHGRSKAIFLVILGVAISKFSESFGNVPDLASVIAGCRRVTSVDFGGKS